MQPVLSLEIASIPLEWKSANVTPIPKNGDDSVLNNYRPISVLPIVAKVMERIVFDQIYNFLQHHSLLTPLQSGFRPEHSTQGVLVKMLDDWRMGIDADHIIASLILDLSKAFDTINRSERL